MCMRVDAVQILHTANPFVLAGETFSGDHRGTHKVTTVTTVFKHIDSRI
jgi:hypothetical protein